MRAAAQTQCLLALTSVSNTQRTSHYCTCATAAAASARLQLYWNKIKRTAVGLAVGASVSTGAAATGGFVTGRFVAGGFVTTGFTGAFVTGAFVTGAFVTGALVTGALVTGAFVTGAAVSATVGAGEGVSVWGACVVLSAPVWCGEHVSQYVRTSNQTVYSSMCVSVSSCCTLLVHMCISMAYSQQVVITHHLLPIALLVLSQHAW